MTLWITIEATIINIQVLDKKEAISFNIGQQAFQTVK